MKTSSLFIANLIMVSFCALFLSGCSSEQSQPAEEAPSETTVTLSETQAKNAAIETGIIRERSISTSLKLNGRIDVPPQNIVSVSVPMGGYLKYTKLLPGMHVNKGEVIAVMEDQQYIQLQQDYLTARTRLSFLTQEYQRQLSLNQTKASSDKVFQQAQADYQAEKINVKSLGEKLKLIGLDPDQLSEDNISKSVNIHSPINGYVSHVNVNIGKYTQPSEVLFELINPADIHLALTVFEKDLPRLSIGQKVVAYTNYQPNKKFDCEIILIGMNLSPERSTEVHCHFEKYDKSLVPGMYMNAEVELANYSANVVPEEAVVRFDGKHYVFVETAVRQYTLTEVTIGQTTEGWVEIVNAESLHNKPLALKGAYTLLMSLKNKEEEE